MLSEGLKIVVRFVSAVFPRCLRCLMLMLSGPVELLFFACLMADEVCSIVICMGVDFSLLIGESVYNSVSSVCGVLDVVCELIVEVF